MRISTLDLNNVKTALACRDRVRKLSLREEAPIVKPSRIYYDDVKNHFGENVKTVHNITRRPKLLTLEEKDELVARYENGTAVMELAKSYGCHRTTVGNILRARGIAAKAKGQQH